MTKETCPNCGATFEPRCPVCGELAHAPLPTVVKAIDGTARGEALPSNPTPVLATKKEHGGLGWGAIPLFVITVVIFYFAFTDWILRDRTGDLFTVVSALLILVWAAYFYIADRWGGRP